MKKLSIIICVYNERKTVLTLLKKVYSCQLTGITKEIVIVEDNSKDGTREIIKEFVKNKSGIKLILQDRGMGKGTAFRRGLKEISGDIVLIQDADLEYDVNDYEKLVRPIVDGKTMFVLGSRHLKNNGKTDWLIRRFGGRERLYAHFMNFGGLIFHMFFNLMYGTHLTDPTTMYKVFSSKLLKEVHLKGEYFEIDWEIVCKFVRLGYIPLEIPVRYVSRGNSDGKKIRFSRDVVRWVYMIIYSRLCPISAI